MGEQDRGARLDQVFKSLKGVKLKGGIFGKVCLLLVVVAVCISVVCVKDEVWWVPLALLLPFMAIILYALKRCFDFAEKNPVAAIVDGAELVAYEQATQGRKGHDNLPPAPHVLDHQITPLPQGEILEADPPPVSDTKRLARVAADDGGGNG